MAANHHACTRPRISAKMDSRSRTTVLFFPGEAAVVLVRRDVRSAEGPAYPHKSRAKSPRRRIRIPKHESGKTILFHGLDHPIQIHEGDSEPSSEEIRYQSRATCTEQLESRLDGATARQNRSIKSPPKVAAEVCSQKQSVRVCGKMRAKVKRRRRRRQARVEERKEGRLRRGRKIEEGGGGFRRCKS